MPFGHWKAATFVGALRLTGLTTPMVLDGAMNGRAFIAYVRQVLAPTLAPRETSSSWTTPRPEDAGRAAAIEAVGAQLFILPPYSPDRTPILLDLVNDLLDMSRVEAGLIKLDITCVPIPPVIDDVLVSLRPLA